ncbi:PAS domain S-box protein [Spirulina subsalsa FACHB-351]|uniref:PAS domain S-box protein n=1 Tax=Spirulina subsalsa FACHB-351 TaxID=234711 RepID=A0ABT3L3W6_9CYAN|nr:adenylate/guanylate cyclase domain-containing protein [Spirulina subsalsa]MCW6035680.1 PAS domain S-box protein [Spirulina subsalsa FACHB-351]
MQIVLVSESHQSIPEALAVVREASRREGMLMAIAEINQQGGVFGQPLELRCLPLPPWDERNHVEAWYRGLETLLAGGEVGALFGGWTAQGEQALVHLVESTQTLLFSPLCPHNVASSRQVFYTGSCANQHLETALDWLQATGRQRCYLLTSNHPDSQNQGRLTAHLWQERGGEIMASRCVPVTQPDFSGILADIEQHQPDMVLNLLMGQPCSVGDSPTSPYAPFYRDYHRAGLGETCPLLTLFPSELEESHPELDYPPHYRVTPYSRHFDHPINQAFLAHCAASQRTPSAPLLKGYSEVYLWKQGVELAGTVGANRVSAALYGLGWTGPQGLVYLETNQAIAQPIYIEQYLNPQTTQLVYQTLGPVRPLPHLDTLATWGKTQDPSAIAPPSLWEQLQGERQKRAQIEAALQDYAIELRTIFSALTDAILVTDAQGCYLRIAPTNPAHKPSAELIGKTLYDVFPPQQAQDLLNKVQEALTTGQSVTCEYALAPNQAQQWGLNLDRNHKENFWFTATLAPITPQSVLWVIRNITQEKQIELEKSRILADLEQQFAERTTALMAANDELIGEIVDRRLAESALRNAKDQLEAVLDAVPGIVSWIGADLCYLGVNRHLAKVFNRPPEYFVGQHIGFLDASSEFVRFVEEFFESDREDDFREITNVIKGSPRNYLIVAQKYNQGQAAFTVGIDITERQQAIEDLARSKDQLQAVLDAVPGIVSWISCDLRYLGVNRQLAQTFNLRPEDFAGKNIGFLQASTDFNHFVSAFFASPETDSFREVEAIVKGDTRNYLIAAQKYDQGQAAFTVGIDITDRQRALDDLARSKDQLQAILEAVPGIVSWISSDLRYLGVNRHLAETFNLKAEDFVGQDIGFLQSSSEFNTFVREFFASPQSDAFREVRTLVRGERRNFLIAAQKYDQGRAAFTVGIDITERQKALDALKEAENKYRTIFENAVEGIFQSSPQGRYLSANPALARIYGYDSPEALIEQVTDLSQEIYVDANSRQHFRNILNQDGSVVAYESQIRRRDGTVRWISENARAVHDETGRLLYYEGTVEDITERKQAEEDLRRFSEELEQRVHERTLELQDLNLQLLMEIGERERVESALRTSEAELRALFAAMTDVITVFDGSGCYAKIVTTNSELLYSPQMELLGRSVDEVHPPEQADMFKTHIQEALNTGQTVSADYSLLIPNSQGEMEETWFAASVSPLPNHSVIWVARNVTERRRVLNALQEAEEKYRSIFENAAEGIFQITPDGGYISANPALVKMYGFKDFAELAVEVQNIGEQLYVCPEEREELIERLEELGSVSGFKAQVRRKDGGLIWTSENVRVVRDEEGGTLYYEGTVADITQQKAAEDALHLEREKSERLLLNILPRSIAERLKQEEQSIAERFDNVSILFADIVDFTSLSASISPTELVDLLNQIFSAFDQLADWYNLEKIKTIGDSYMVAGGFPETEMQHHIEAIADMGLDMQRAIRRFDRMDGKPFRLRIGIHTGPVVAGVIGIKKFIYDLWGDTVNVASRMESQGMGDRIQVTAEVYEVLKHNYWLEERGEIEVKGRGIMTTYWLMGRN